MDTPKESSRADLVTGEIRAHAGDAVVLATGGYGNVFYLSTNASGCNVTATCRAYKKGALFANPCYTQIHPTCIPVTGEHQSKLTLMSESLRNDGRVWVPKQQRGLRKTAERDSRSRARLLSRTKISELRQSRAARHFFARAPRKFATKGAASVRAGAEFISISPTPSNASAKNTIRERYGNLFDMYEKITGENAYKQPMRIYPAVHYTMGGLWVDYNLMSNIPGLARDRRSEFFRSRRESPRRQRAHARLGRRLFRVALHAAELFRRTKWANVRQSIIRSSRKPKTTSALARRNC